MHLIRPSLRSTLKSPRWVIGNAKLDGWALKASAVLRCQPPSEPGAKWKLQGWKEERVDYFATAAKRKNQKLADSGTGECFREWLQQFCYFLASSTWTARMGSLFPPAAKHIGVTSEMPKVSLNVACKADQQAIAKIINKDKHDGSWG